MAKDQSLYFSHDSNSRRDPKLVKLLRVVGWNGYGLYWAIVEQLRESDQYRMETDYESIAYDMQTQCKTIKNIVENFKLFKIKDGWFWTESLLRRMKLKDEKSKKCSDSANKRWEKERK